MRPLIADVHSFAAAKEQRDEHIRRYAELIEARSVISTQNAAKLKTPENPKGAGRPMGIPRQIAEETGLSVDTVRRALNPKPAPEPKAPLADHEVVTIQFNALMAAWNRAYPSESYFPPNHYLKTLRPPHFQTEKSASEPTRKSAQQIPQRRQAKG